MGERSSTSSASPRSARATWPNADGSGAGGAHASLPTATLPTVSAPPAVDIARRVCSTGDGRRTLWIWALLGEAALFCYPDNVEVPRGGRPYLPTLGGACQHRGNPYLPTPATLTYHKRKVCRRFGDRLTFSLPGSGVRLALGRLGGRFGDRLGAWLSVRACVRNGDPN